MKFELTILGSSSALPTSERFPTAHVLNVHERFFLIDCAEGTQMQLRRNRIPMGKIHHIFISHLHGDHYFGLPGLLSSLGLIGRRVPLHLYGPPELKDKLDAFAHAKEQLEFEIVFKGHAYDAPKLLLETTDLEVWSIPMLHKVPTVGFVFREKLGQRLISRHEDAGETVRPRTLAWYSDTRFNPETAECIRHANLLYHEATYDHSRRERAWSTGHSTAREAAQMAKLAEVGQLVIGHFSARYKSVDSLVNEAREVFENTQAAYDGLKIDIPFINRLDL